MTETLKSYCTLQPGASLLKSAVLMLGTFDNKDAVNGQCAQVLLIQVFFASSNAGKVCRKGNTVQAKASLPVCRED